MHHFRKSGIYGLSSDTCMKKQHSEPSTCCLSWDSFPSSQLLSSPATFQRWGLSFLASSQTLWFCITYILLIFCSVPRLSGLKGGGVEKSKERQCEFLPFLFLQEAPVPPVLASLLPWLFCYCCWSIHEFLKAKHTASSSKKSKGVLACLLPWDSFLSLWLERPPL